MRMNFSVPVAALVAGAALGYCFAPSQSAPEAAEAGSGEGKPAGMIADAGDEASVRALRARVKELELLLAAAEARLSSSAEEERVDERSRRRGERWNPREELARLKETDPERYATITNRFAHFRRRRQERAQMRMEYFNSIDMSGMDAAAQETHARLVGLIARREDIENAIHDENSSDEAREAAMQEMFMVDGELRDLNMQERWNLLAATMGELGYSGEDAEEIVSAVSDIIRATESDFGGPGGPPRGPGGPGGPDGPGGPRP